jgi:hypothetical protein
MILALPAWSLTIPNFPSFNGLIFPVTKRTVYGKAAIKIKKHAQIRYNLALVFMQ